MYKFLLGLLVTLVVVPCSARLCPQIQVNEEFQKFIDRNDLNGEVVVDFYLSKKNEEGVFVPLGKDRSITLPIDRKKKVCVGTGTTASREKDTTLNMRASLNLVSSSGNGWGVACSHRAGSSDRGYLRQPLKSKHTFLLKLSAYREVLDFVEGVKGKPSCTISFEDNSPKKKDVKARRR
ncbi:MAG: hypothetical protein GY915_04405 [bacterium]|nr:hypothetical protein [bacterium]